MKIELSHDILARNIFDKASAEDKMRLKIINFIKNRYIYYTESKVLLKKEDLNYIESYLPKIELTAEELAFIKKSKNKTRWQVIWGVATTVVLIISLVTSLILVEQNRRHMERLKDKANNDAIKAEKEKEEKAKTLAALELKELERQKAMALVDDKEKLLNLSNEKLVKLVQELEAKSELEKKLKIDLEAANKKLAEQNKVLASDIKAKEQEKTKLSDSNKAKTQELAKATEAKAKADSRILSSKALYELHANENRSAAFQMAAEAYRIDPTNEEACAVIYEISTSSKDYFDRKDGPKKDTDKLIKELQRNLGTLNNDTKNKVLQGTWIKTSSATLKKINPR